MEREMEGDGIREGGVDGKEEEEEGGGRQGGEKGVGWQKRGRREERKGKRKEKIDRGKDKDMRKEIEGE